MARESQREYSFSLTYNGNTTTIDQPDGFADFESEIKRDFEAHGLFYRYTSGTLRLRFSSGRGKEILETAFREKGIDAVVDFKVESRPDDLSTLTFTEDFFGTAIMAHRQVDKDYFDVDFEDQSFTENIKNRFDVKVNLESTTDLDGNAVSAATSYTSQWNRIRRNTNFQANHVDGADDTQKTDIDTSVSGVSDPATRYWTPFFEEVTVDDLGTPDTFSKTTNWVSSKPTNTNKFFTIDKSGTLTFDAPTFKHQMQFNNVCTTPGGSIIAVDYTWTLEHYRGGVLQNTYDNTTGGLSLWGMNATNVGPASCPTTASHDEGLRTADLASISFTVAAADTLVFYIRATIDDTGGGTVTGDFNLDIYDNAQIRLVLLDQARTYTVKSYLIFDVIEKIVANITGESNAVLSDFYKTTEQGAPSDGCAALRVITSGFQLRGINNPPEVSLAEVLGSLKAIDNAGWGIENIYDSLEFALRVEPMEFFYEDVQSFDFGNVDDFEASSFDELEFNKFNIGYQSFSKGEDDTVGDDDDFLSQVEYYVPVDKINNSKTLVSPLIASGHIITTGFDQRGSSKAWRRDDDNFIVVVERTAGPNFVPENDGEATDIAGIDNAASAYNIRIAPVFMFVNHALFVNSVTKGKDISETYKNIKALVNKDFEARVSANFACQDQMRLVRTSTGDIAIEEMNYGFRLWSPTAHRFQKRMTRNEIIILIDRLTGNSQAKRYGYFRYLDENDNEEFGFPLVISWNPVSELAKFECVERADNYLQ